MAHDRIIHLVGFIYSLELELLMGGSPTAALHIEHALDPLIRNRIFAVISKP
jgi:hypothetical protein